MARLGAGTRKRADGTLEKRFTIDGKRYSVYGKNAKEISQKEQEIRKKIEAGIYTDNRNITLDKYFGESSFSTSLLCNMACAVSCTIVFNVWEAVKNLVSIKFGLS